MGGYLACDKDTTLRVKPLWARILVNLKYKDIPMSINNLAGLRSFELWIWWEIAPWVAEVFSSRHKNEEVCAELGEEDEGKLCARKHMRAGLGASNHESKRASHDVAL